MLVMVDIFCLFKKMTNQVGEVGADGDVVLVGPQLALPELEERRLLP